MSKPVKRSKRSKMVRYSPARVKALRDEMLKCANPVYAQMVAPGNMSDGDLVDFAVSLAGSYFSGHLLQVFKETATANLDLQRRRGVLVTAAFFGATAAFDKDGMNLIRIGDDPDTITFAVQQLVNVGFTVAEAMRQLTPPPPAPCQMESDIRAELPELVN